MKISQLVSPLHSVHKDSNHAIYGHVGNLCNGLSGKGHKVSLFASGDSQTKAEFFPSTRWL